MITEVTLDIRLFFTLQDSVKGPHLKINSSKMMKFTLNKMNFLHWGCWGWNAGPRLQKESTLL